MRPSRVLHGLPSGVGHWFCAGILFGNLRIRLVVDVGQNLSHFRQLSRFLHHLGGGRRAVFGSRSGRLAELCATRHLSGGQGRALRERINRGQRRRRRRQETRRLRLTRRSRAEFQRRQRRQRPIVRLRHRGLGGGCLHLLAATDPALGRGIGRLSLIRRLILRLRVGSNGRRRSRDCRSRLRLRHRWIIGLIVGPRDRGPSGRCGQRGEHESAGQAFHQSV